MLTFILLASLAQDAASPRRFFDRADVDFWGSRKAPLASSSLWVEPVVGNDGRVQVYVPPREVREFLESPTRENGAKYLAWQRERIGRLRKAAQILAEIRSDVREPTLLYFSKPGCPYCVAQERVLAELKFPVTRVESNSPLWGTHGVNATPTLVWVRPGKPPRKFEGYTSREILEKEVRRVDR